MQPIRDPSAETESRPVPALPDPVAASLIRRKARQLARTAGFSRGDVEDLEQELTLKLLKQRGSFRPSRARWPAFVSTVVERHAATIVRDRRAAKRYAPGVASLQAARAGGRPPLAASVGRREADARRLVAPRPDDELAELRSDVREVVAQLPDDERGLAERLMAGSLAAAARDLGTPRTSLSTQVRAIRRRFERAGLRDYL